MAKLILLDNKNPIPTNLSPIFRIYYKGALFSNERDTSLCKEFTSLEEFTKCYINFAMSSYTILKVVIDNANLEE